MKVSPSLFESEFLMRLLILSAVLMASCWAQAAEKEQACAPSPELKFFTTHVPKKNEKASMTFKEAPVFADAQPFATGLDISKIEFARNEYDARIAVMQLTEAGRQKFLKATSASIGREMPIVVGTEVLSSAIVQGRIGANGSGLQVSLGAFDKDAPAKMAKLCARKK